MIRYVLKDSPDLDFFERIEEVREALVHLFEHDWKISFPNIGTDRMWIAMDSVPELTLSRGFFHPIASQSVPMAASAHQNYLLFTCNRQYQVSFDERKIFAAAGDVVILSNKSSYQVKVDSANIASSMIVDGTMLDEMWSEAPYLVGKKLAYGTLGADRVHDAMRLAWTCSESGCFGTVASRLIGIIAHQLAISGLLSPIETCDIVAGACRSEVKAFIDERLQTPELTIAMVAEVLGYSIRHIQYCFSEVGETASGYLREKRLELAASMLSSPTSSDRRITEVAYACGYNSSSYFSTEFRKKFNESPASFRDRIRQEVCINNAAHSQSRFLK